LEDAKEIDEENKGWLQASVGVSVSAPAFAMGSLMRLSLCMCMCMLYALGVRVCLCLCLWLDSLFGTDAKTNLGHLRVTPLIIRSYAAHESSLSRRDTCIIPLLSWRFSSAWIVPSSR
jgi:hypothetical protein